MKVVALRNFQDSKEKVKRVANDEFIVSQERYEEILAYDEQSPYVKEVVEEEKEEKKTSKKTTKKGK